MTVQSTPATITDLQAGAAFSSLTGSITYIKMTTAKTYTDGTRLGTGQTYPVDSSWAQMAIDNGWALYVAGRKIDDRMIKLQSPLAVTGLVNVALGTDPVENAAMTSAAMLSGKGVRFSGSGNRKIASPIIVPSNSYITMDSDCYPQSPNSAHFALWRNADSQNAIPVSMITVGGGIAKIAEYGHNKVVGKTYYVEGALGNTTLNGPVVCVAVTTGVLPTWSFQVASNAALTNTNAQRIMVMEYNPIPGASFTRVSNIVTVKTTRPATPGDHIYITGSIAGANSFKGMFTIIGVTQGVSFTFLCPGVDETASGVANLLGNTNIVLDNFQYDGNRTNNNFALDEWLDFQCQFINVGNMRVITRQVRNTVWRGLGFWNAAEIEVPYCAFDVGAVGIQFDSNCDGVRISKAVGRNLVDDVVAWGITSAAGPFGMTTCPSGQASMGSLTIEEIDGDSPTGIFKHYCTSGYDLGSIRIRRQRGAGRGLSGDSQVGVSGGTVTSMVVEQFECTLNAATQTGIAIGGCSAYKNVEIHRSFDNYSSTSGSFFCLVTAAVERLVFNDITSESYGAAVNPYAKIQVDNGADVKLLEINRPYVTVGRGDVIDAFVRVASGGRIRHLKITEPKIFGFGGYNTGTYAGCLVAEAAGGRIDKITIVDPSFPDGQLLTLLYLGGGATTTEIDIIGYSQGLADDTIRGRMGTVINDAGTAKSFLINLNGVHLRACPNNFVQCGGSGTHRIKGVNLDLPADKLALLNVGTVSVSIDAPDAKIDMGVGAASPPARLVPLAGDRLYNTGRGLYGRTAAGAWQLIF